MTAKLAYCALALLTLFGLANNLHAQEDPVALRRSLDRMERSDAGEARDFDALGGAPASVRVLPAFTFTLDVTPTWDDNPLGLAAGSADDWHLDIEASLVAKIVESGPWTVSLLGIYTGSRYEEFGSQDFDSSTLGGSVVYKLAAHSKLKLQGVQARTYSRGFGDLSEIKNRLSIAWINDITDILKERLKSDKWEGSLTPSVRRDTFDGPGIDRTRAALNLELVYAIDGKWSLTFGGTASYTWRDSANNFFDTELYGELAYKLRDDVTVKASTYYLHRDRENAASIEQFTGAPLVLSISKKF